MLLLSEIYRLVLGFLEDENLPKTYETLLNEAKYLEECREILKKGIFFQKTIHGKTLFDYLWNENNIEFVEPEKESKETQTYKISYTEKEIQTEIVNNLISVNNEKVKRTRDGCCQTDYIIVNVDENLNSTTLNTSQNGSHIVSFKQFGSRLKSELSLKPLVILENNSLQSTPLIANTSNDMQSNNKCNESEIISEQTILNDEIDKSPIGSKKRKNKEVKRRTNLLATPTKTSDFSNQLVSLPSSSPNNSDEEVINEDELMLDVNSFIKNLCEGNFPNKLAKSINEINMKKVGNNSLQTSNTFDDIRLINNNSMYILLNQNNNINASILDNTKKNFNENVFASNSQDVNLPLASSSEVNLQEKVDSKVDLPNLYDDSAQFNIQSNNGNNSQNLNFTITAANNNDKNNDLADTTLGNNDDKMEIDQLDNNSKLCLENEDISLLAEAFTDPAFQTLFDLLNNSQQEFPFKDCTVINAAENIQCDTTNLFTDQNFVHIENELNKSANIKITSDKSKLESIHTANDEKVSATNECQIENKPILGNIINNSKNNNLENEMPDNQNLNKSLKDSDEGKTIQIKEKSKSPTKIIFHFNTSSDLDTSKDNDLEKSIDSSLIENSQNEVKQSISLIHLDDSDESTCSIKFFPDELKENKLKDIEPGKPLVVISETKNSLIIISKTFEDINRIENEWKSERRRKKGIEKSSNEFGDKNDHKNHSLVSEILNSNSNTNQEEAINSENFNNNSINISNKFLNETDNKTNSTDIDIKCVQNKQEEDLKNSNQFEKNINNELNFNLSSEKITLCSSKETYLNTEKSFSSNCDEASSSLQQTENETEKPDIERKYDQINHEQNFQVIDSTQSITHDENIESLNNFSTSQSVSINKTNEELFSSQANPSLKNDDTLENEEENSSKIKLKNNSMESNKDEEKNLFESHISNQTTISNESSSNFIVEATTCKNSLHSINKDTDLSNPNENNLTNKNDENNLNKSKNQIELEIKENNDQIQIDSDIAPNKNETRMDLDLVDQNPLVENDKNIFNSEAKTNSSDEEVKIDTEEYKKLEILPTFESVENNIQENFATKSNEQTERKEDNKVENLNTDSYNDKNIFNSEAKTNSSDEEVKIDTEEYNKLETLPTFEPVENNIQENFATKSNEQTERKEDNKVENLNADSHSNKRIDLIENKILDSILINSFSPIKTDQKDEISVKSLKSKNVIVYKLPDCDTSNSSESKFFTPNTSIFYPQSIQSLFEPKNLLEQSNSQINQDLKELNNLSTIKSIEKEVLDTTEKRSTDNIEKTINENYSEKINKDNKTSNNLENSKMILSKSIEQIIEEININFEPMQQIFPKTLDVPQTILNTNKKEKNSSINSSNFNSNSFSDAKNSFSTINENFDAYKVRQLRAQQNLSRPKKSSKIISKILQINKPESSKRIKDIINPVNYDDNTSIEYYQNSSNYNYSDSNITNRYDNDLFDSAAINHTSFNLNKNFTNQTNQYLTTSTPFNLKIDKHSNKTAESMTKISRDKKQTKRGYFPDFCENIMDDEENQERCSNNFFSFSSQILGSSNSQLNSDQYSLNQANNRKRKHPEQDFFNDDEDGIPNIIKYARKVQETVKNKLKRNQKSK